MYHDNKNYESPGKTAARARSYASISRVDMYSKYHIVIASRECGDIKFLLNHGVAKKKIIATDIDTIALERARSFGVKIFPVDNIVDTVLYAKRHEFPLASINCDLCFSLVNGLPILKRVLAANHFLGSVPVFFTFMIGRRDGMNSTKKRISLLEDTIFPFTKKETIKYTSWTREAQGSSMMTVII